MKTADLLSIMTTYSSGLFKREVEDGLKMKYVKEAGPDPVWRWAVTNAVAEDEMTQEKVEEAQAGVKEITLRVLADLEKTQEMLITRNIIDAVGVGVAAALSTYIV